MAKTKRRDNKVRNRRTKSRRGGGPYTIHGITYGINDAVPFHHRHLLPYNGPTQSQLGFPKGIPFTPSQNWGVTSATKPPKTDLQRLAKRLAKKFDAEKDLIERDETLHRFQKYLAIKAKEIEMNVKLDEAAKKEAHRHHEAVLRASMIPTLRKSVTGVKHRLGSAIKSVTSGISKRVNQFMNTLEPQQTYSKEQLNGLTHVHMSHLMEGMSPHMVQDIDWDRLTSITKDPKRHGSLWVQYDGNNTPMLVHSEEYSASQLQKGV